MDKLEQLRERLRNAKSICINGYGERFTVLYFNTWLVLQWLCGGVTMVYEYGEFAPNQVADIKHLLQKKIFFLLIIADPKNQGQYKNVDIPAALSIWVINLFTLSIHPPGLSAFSQ